MGQEDAKWGYSAERGGGRTLEALAKLLDGERGRIKKDGLKKQKNLEAWDHGDSNIVRKGEENIAGAALASSRQERFSAGPDAPSLGLRRLRGER